MNSVSPLKIGRITAGASQYDAAKILGISPSMFSKLETGQAPIKPEQIQKLAAAWKTSSYALTVKPSRLPANFETDFGTRSPVENSTRSHKYWAGQVDELRAEARELGAELVSLRSAETKAEQEHRAKLQKRICEVDEQIQEAQKNCHMYLVMSREAISEERKIARACRLDHSVIQELDAMSRDLESRHYRAMNG